MQITKNKASIRTVEDWRLHAPPKGKDGQWELGRSALECARAWCGGDQGPCVPQEITALLNSHADTRDAEIVTGTPEHRVRFDKLRGEPRNTDLVLLARNKQGALAISIEAKADEPFGDTLATWKGEESIGKGERLRYLYEVLKCQTDLPPATRYQLVHRTASAVIEAKRTGSAYAVMMVQSFREKSPSESDFVAFGKCFDVSLSVGSIVRLTQHTDPKLYLGWAVSPVATERDIALVRG